MQDKEIYNSIYAGLKVLEISKRSSDLYVLSLSFGSISITELSKKLGIARPNVYKLITELDRHELIEKNQNSNTSGPTVVSPNILLAKVRKKEEKLERISQSIASNLPELLSVYAQESGVSKVKIFEGKEQYIKAFDLIFEESNSTTKFFGSAEDFVIFTQWQGYNKLVQKRIKKNIKLQSLLLPSEVAKNMKRRASVELRDVRILKGIDTFNTSFQLFSKKVLFWQPNTPVAILIEDEYITQMMQSMFDYMWNNSKK